MIVLKVQILNLNASLDHTGILKHKEESNIIRVDEVIELVGGKGVNVARVLQRLNFADYELSNIIGGSVGTVIENKLKEEKIKAWNYSIRGNSRINYILVDEINNQIKVINENGPHITEKEKKQYLDQLFNWMKENQILVFAGSATTGFKRDDIRSILQKAKSKQMIVMVDLSEKYLSSSLQEDIDLIKINAREFIDEFGEKYNSSFEDPRNFVDIIEKENLSRIIITFGKEGALLFDDGVIWLGKVLKAFSNYSIGSGDSFLAGFVYGFVNKYPKNECLKLAMACGAANTLKYGAGVFNYRDVCNIKDKFITVEKM